MAPSSNANWDPVLLISQDIVSMQTLHYLTLSFFVPPLLTYFAEQESLAYEGGASNVGMVMDWREMAGRPTVRGIQGEEWWNAFAGAWSGGRKVGHNWHDFEGRTDPIRGWIIAFCWMVACSADIYYMYSLVRRPRLVLDFALTLVFNHLVLTTYYSASLPTSLFFWLVMVAGAILTVIVTEQLCVKREMTEGLTLPTIRPEEQEVEEMELLSRRD
ncbi:hypothetical protein BDN72DRAFT_761048 [Pluteus cervinus]|uniref:Uncharacterized protein n=1 Tax=Pluteus cervinus TaxID=181527 RepID=A0ACD3B6V6_9AGAR|nr:hypothetical protein BDN72DRAFT_761048 [Pluteus cervinus]